MALGGKLGRTYWPSDQCYHTADTGQAVNRAYADRKTGSRFLPPRSIRQDLAEGCLDARNQKEVGGATKRYGEALLTTSIERQPRSFGLVLLTLYWQIVRGHE